MSNPSILDINSENKILHTLRGFSYKEIAYDWLYRFAKDAIRHKVVSPFRILRLNRVRFVEGVPGWQHIRWSFIDNRRELEAWEKRTKGASWVRP